MKLKDYVKAGFGVSVGFFLAKGVLCALVKALTRDVTNKPESEKETETETEE